MTTNAAEFDRAQRVLVGGVNSAVRAFRAVGGTPRFIDRAQGAYLWDVEGRQYIDYVGSWGPAIVGHAHPLVVERVKQAAGNGLSFGAPNIHETELAEKICVLYPHVEQVRFTSSGTEAAMSALRLARGQTGRTAIIKFDGCYHGTADSLLVKAGSGALAFGTPSSAGVPEDLAKHTLVAQYNDLASVERLLDEHKDQVACVMIEPIPGNMNLIMPADGFLQGLRDLCTRHKTLLIFDEVMSGFRVALGGAQEALGVTPDLTAMGKIIGGGLPIGAFGGREDIMRMFHPDEPNPVMHASTFSGNVLSMAAGDAAMAQIDPQTIEHANLLGETFREGANALFAQHGIRGQATGYGSLSNLHFIDAPLNDARDSLTGIAGAGAFGALLHLAMLRRGVASAARLMYCTSTAMSRDDISFALDALDDALRELRPGMAAERPTLLN